LAERTRFVWNRNIAGLFDKCVRTERQAMQTTTQNPGQATGQTTGQSAGNDGGAGNELRADAQKLGSKAADRIHGEVDSRKGQAVSQAQSFSSAIEKTAGEMNDGPEWLKSALHKGAQSIQRFADSIEQKDSRQLMRDAQTFARDNPGTFLAACAAAGFAAARVFRAGAEDSRQQGQWDSSVEVGGPSGATQQPLARTNPPGEFV
jgi:ElaB/YqjD/DUF883 family membrane-anchored ribosome-binding protein